jgi:signal transduction histidine kinase
MKNTFSVNIIPEKDEQRVAAVHRYRLLDTPSEKVFDNMTTLAADMFSMPISLISLVDAENVFFKSTLGAGNLRCVDRGESLCALAILSEDVLVFENTLNEPILAKSPVVHGPAKVRFYAGAPLMTPDGYLIGTICVVDHRPRSFGEHERQLLSKLAGVVMEQMELRLAALSDVEKQQQLNEQKLEFISVASHELRTPVTTLSASLQLLYGMKDQPKSNFPRLITQAYNSSVKLNKLIRNLLDISRLEAGQTKLQKTVFVMAHLVAQCCNHVRQAGTHQLIIEGDTQLKVEADEQKIDQVMVNLVNNAVKYAPGSKDIYIGIQREDRMVKITVKDQGPGVAKEQQSRLFERYYRMPQNQRLSGMGLGLYICAEIVRQHGGEIGLESELGKGSIFWFTLPLANNNS